MSNSGNRLMKLAASCNQLNQRDFPYDFVLYYYPVASEKESFSGTTQSMRKAVCDDLRGVTIDTKDAEDTVAKTVNELKQDMNLSKISNSKYLGLLAENAHGCYAGILATTSNSHGSYVSYADVLATVIHAKSLWVSLNTKYQNPSDSQKTLLRLQAIAAELDAKNPD